MEATELCGGPDPQDAALPVEDRDRSDGFVVRRKSDSARRVLHSSFLTPAAPASLRYALGVSPMTRRNVVVK